ncbi:MAG TPA: ribonuclease P protein component [Ktedonobacterales bacterium]|nr:ribonuclease P protein component [Ktedonobacterales bacterium]
MEQNEVILHSPGRERFRRAQRLRSPHDFQRVRRLGRHVSSPLLTLSYARQAPQTARTQQPDEEHPDLPPEASTAGTMEPPTRIGFSVSKRVGNAVIRNRVKRRLREAARHMLTDLLPGWDIVLGARSAAAAADYATLDTTVRELLARARLTHLHSSRGLL